MTSDLIDDCREAFEKWAADSDKGPIKPFTSWENDFCWFAWKAAWELQCARVKGCMA